jgi:uncharacterized membrane protein
MNKTLIELFGLDPEQFNEVSLILVTKDLSVAWVFLLLVFPLALWFFWASLKRIHLPLRKIFIITLRTLVFFIVVFIFLQPELEFKKKHTLENRIAVLVDDTQSMSIKTFPSEQSRIDFVRQAFKKNQDVLESLANVFQLDYYLISDQIESISPIGLDEWLSPKKINTNFETVLSGLKKQYDDKSLQGVMLFSDGADLTVKSETISPELLTILATWGSPIHSFQAGSNYMFKDLAIEEIDSAGFGFIDQPVSLTVTIGASNMGNRNIPLVLKDGDKILLSRVVEVREGENSYPVKMEFTPSVLGKHIYTLNVPLFAGESIAVNNRKDFHVKVIRDRIRVLHLNGRPSWDSRFLREVLANHPKIDLLSFFILRTLDDDVASPTSELSLIPFPTNLLFSDYLNSFDLILFQNFGYKPFIDKGYLTNIKNFVESGGAFVMMGGELSFQGGGYAQTDLEEILPVNLEGSIQSFENESFSLQLEKNSSHHPILQLEKESVANRSVWENLPKLNGINIGLKPRKNSNILASFIRGRNKYPLIVTGRFGKGRSLVVATDSLWNWNFRQIGEGGSGRYYNRFWNNLINWLIDEPETRLLKLETHKEHYEEGEEVLLRVSVLKSNYDPYPGAQVRLILKTHSDSKKLKTISTNENGEASYRFTPEEGFYTVKAEVDSGKRKLEEKTGFSVFSETAEFQKPRVNETLLRRIAEVSGGDYEVLTDKTDFSKVNFSNPRIETNTSSKHIPLWDNWWVYGLILIFLSLDWFTRRKSGLS